LFVFDHMNACVFVVVVGEIMVKYRHDYVNIEKVEGLNDEQIVVAVAVEVVEW